MKRATVWIMLLAALLMVLVATTGCEKAAEKAAEKAIEGATGVDIDADDDSVTIEGEDGETVEIQGDSGEVPDGFPDDVPVYDGDIQTTSKVSTGEGTAYYVELTTDDGASDVHDWYKSEFESEGWAIQMDTTSTQNGAFSGLLMAEKDGAQVSMTLEESDGVTGVFMTVNTP